MTARLSYYFLTRQETQTEWENAKLDGVDPQWRDMVESAMYRAAKSSKMRLKSLTPRAGFVATERKDGREWPCPPDVPGARPVWIWAAER